MTAPFVQLDLGVDDVHLPGSISKRKARPMTSTKQSKKRLAQARRPGDKSAKSAAVAPVRARPLGSSKGLRMRINASGDITVRHSSDIVGGKALFLEQYELDSSRIELTDDGKSKQVWIQVAKPGIFKGHPAGAFSLDSTTFADIVRNFRATANRRIPIDFEHASEASATSGTVPHTGAPAQGWMLDFDQRADGLYALVEWLPLAAGYIKSGAYRFFSPAIRFDAKDRVSGLNIGARMTSGALTNKPFLDGLRPLVARDFDAEPETPEERAAETVELLDASGYAVSPDTFLPRFRAALNMDELASPSDMLARVDRIIDLCEMAGGDASAVVEGIAISNYVGPLRDLMRMPMNTTTSDLLEAVAEMIESCMPEDDADETGANMTEGEHSPEAEPVQPAGPAPATEGLPIMETITLSEHEAKVKVAVSEAVSSEVAKATAPLKLDLKDAEAAKSEAEAAKVLAEAEVVKLTEQLKKRDTDAQSARVEEAFDTYKDSRKLTDDDKEAMTIVLSNNAGLFEKRYPRITADKKHLLRDISRDGSKLASDGKLKAVPTLVELTQAEQRKNPALSYDDAFTMALSEQAKLLTT